MNPHLFRFATVILSVLWVGSSCTDYAPSGLRRTPRWPGATIRFALEHKPLPDIPLPSDIASWPDPTSRTGIRLNPSLIAPTSIEKLARERFSQMEGWGTFAPISVSFDIDRSEPGYETYEGPALDLAGIKQRHQGDDYDFANDAVYLVHLKTGVPVPLDVGAGNFSYTLRELGRYWPLDPRASERNLLFETIDESMGGTVTKETFLASLDTDMDGILDRPNLDDPLACPNADPVCDTAGHPYYETTSCVTTRRVRDQCIADRLLSWYELETDTLIVRPLLPLEEMTRYAVVITDRMRDGNGNPVKSPFEFVYPASMEGTAQRVAEIIDDPALASYYGNLSGTGLGHVSFTWSFTTQPTVDDMRRLRDGLYGKGVMSRLGDEFPPVVELVRAVGLSAGLAEGATDPPDWTTSAEGMNAGCPAKAKNLYLIRYADLRDRMKDILVQGFGLAEGPALELLLRSFDHIDYILVGTYRSPFLLEGGPGAANPNAAFHLSFQTGEGEVHGDTVQFLLVVPRESSQFHQPFPVSIYGHGYTGNFTELLLYAGNMAQHGIASIGINAMGHGLVIDDPALVVGAKALLGGACVAPFFDALTQSRARDLNRDGAFDSGGDFWSSYLFHTRDGVRQSVLDHLQLTRILRKFGGEGGRMLCRNASTGWDQPASTFCDLNDDGVPEVAGDFDANGVADIGGPDAAIHTTGESLGGILSAIHGAVDPNVTSAVPGSGGGGLTDIGVRSFQGGVVEAVVLRLLGPLLVSVPADSRPACAPGDPQDRCTVCSINQASLRWIIPDLNRTAEVEIECLNPGDVADTTVFVRNIDNGELRCARVDDALGFRVGLPSSIGDRVEVSFYLGRDAVTDYKSCRATVAEGVAPKLTIDTWGKGRFAEGATNAPGNETCAAPSCAGFQGHFFSEGSPLAAPADGFGLARQSPALRRFFALAQAALDPGDPVSFAPLYAIKPMAGLDGMPMKPRAVLTLNTIGDMNVPISSGIAFARATGALPFFRPDQAGKYPEYAGYAIPTELFGEFKLWTPNQELINTHVIEGITKLARHPSWPAFCNSSANALTGGTFLTQDDEELACFPAGCASGIAACYPGSSCDTAADQCAADVLGAARCEEALWDPEDLDEGTAQYFEQQSSVPHRLARYAEAATPSNLTLIWEPRIRGKPYSLLSPWDPDPSRPLVALLDAYVVPQGTHTFENGNPCQNFDAGTYLTSLTARFFMSGGTDLYYLSHPSTHLCLGKGAAQCDYLQSP